MSHHDLIAQMMGEGGPIYDPFESNGDTVNFGFTSLTGWVDNDTGTAVSSAGTFDGRTVFKMDGGATYDAANVAYRIKNLGAPVGDRLTFTLYFNPDSLNTTGHPGGLGFFDYRYAFATNKIIYLNIYSDALIINVDGDLIDLGPPIMGAWNKLSIDMTGKNDPDTAKANIYLNNYKIISEGAITRTVTLNTGLTVLRQYSRETPIYTQRILYFDLLKIGTA